MVFLYLLEMVLLKMDAKEKCSCPYTLALRINNIGLR